MLTTTTISSCQLAGDGSPSTALTKADRLRRTLSRGIRRLAPLLAPRRAVDLAAIGPDEAGHATLRDLGLLERGRGSPYDLADIHPGIETTRMHLFTLTGRYWSGS